MQYFLFSLFFLFADYAIAQNESYPIQLENGLTILFPAEPIITGMKGVSESYVAETSHGTFTVLVRGQRSSDDSLPSVNVDKVIESMLNNFTNDANLGSVSDTAKIIIGDLKGVYFKMEWKQTNEPTMVVMNLILI